MKKSALIIVLVVVLLVMPLASAGFFDWITGRATSGQTNATVEITSNNAPVIEIVEFDTSNPSVGEGQFEYFVFNFSASDLDGIGDIDNGTGAINLTAVFPSGATRSNSSCAVSASDSNFVNFTCSVGFYYFDIPTPVVWTVTAMVSDGIDTGVNDTESFSLGQTSGMVLFPNSISWAALSAGAYDQATGPTYMNNTGNVNFTYITINASNLINEDSGSWKIDIGNFTVNNSEAAIGSCNSTVLELNNRTTVLTGSGENMTLIRGNLSAADPDSQEKIYYCLDVPTPLATGNYSTRDSRAWEIEVE